MSPKKEEKTAEKTEAKSVEQLEADLAQAQKEVKAKDEQIAEMKKYIAELEKKLNVEHAEEKPELTAAEKKLIAEACDVYGIGDKYVFAAGIDKEAARPTAVIVTAGGAKVRYAAGDTVELPLTEIRITGVNPEAARRKVIAGRRK